MCSIAGFISQKPLPAATAEKLAAALLHFGAERGDQASGVYSNNVVVKHAVAPCAFIKSDDYLDLMRRPTKLALTHTRQPTCGETTSKQAQPFARGRTVTVHNGYYFDVEHLKTKWNIQKQSGVDSELITDFISQYGIKSLPKFLRDTDGPSAIAAVHDGQLYLARTGNPICYATIPVGGTVATVFASTADMLQAACLYAGTLWDAQAAISLPEGHIWQMSANGDTQRIGKHFKYFSYRATKGYESMLDDTYDFATDYSYNKGFKYLKGMKS